MSAAESDRELLELAAKAADYQLSGVSYMIWSHAAAEYIAWNPLADDGDALRLAVACRLLIDTDHCCAMPINRTGEAEGDWSDGMLDDDRDAATRLAIVRAAAEIGRAM